VCGLHCQFIIPQVDFESGVIMWIKLGCIGRTSVRKGNWWRRYHCHDGRIYTQMRGWCMKSLRRTQRSDGKMHIKGVGWSSGVMNEPICD